MTDDAVKLAREVLELTAALSEPNSDMDQMRAEGRYQDFVCEHAPALARAVLAMQWRPIAEADKGGDAMLLFKPDSRRSGASTFVGYWDDRANGWMPAAGAYVVDGVTAFIPLSALAPQEGNGHD